MTFSAPWSKVLKFMTVLSVALLGGIAVIGMVSGPREMIFWVLSMTVIPLLILVSSVFFLIRGYELEPGTLKIHRLGWVSKIPLDGLSSAEANPQAMAGSIRLFGNGGMFSFTGLFRNKLLGNYRAFATDLDRAVILKFPSRTIVVTPDQPQEFVAAVKQMAGMR